ncbi:hypothetical protein ACA910_003084 [Epithemia clementina (nom. ined.)]
MEADLQLSPKLEEQFRNHKVVAFPNQRHFRSTVREIAAANNSKVFHHAAAVAAAAAAAAASTSNNNTTTAQSPPQRARSLSTGRSRYRPANDLISEIHERMSTGLRKTPGGVPLVSNEDMGLSPTSSDINNNCNIGNNHHQLAHQQPHPPGDASIHNTQSGGGGYEAGDNFQSRYRNALVPRGRIRERQVAAAAAGPSDSPETQEPRRARSLSRGKPQLAKRWPPVTTAAATMTTTTGKQQQQQQQQQQSQLQSEQVGDLAPAMVVNHSNSHSSSASPKRPTVATPPKRSLLLYQNTPNSQRTNQVELSPSWNDSNLTSAQGGGSFGEEKKEDYSELQIQTTPSIKERISVYGKTGSATRSTKSSLAAASSKRTVDPSYAAQFALRDHPPKIDIYEGKREDSDVGTITTIAAMQLPPYNNNDPAPVLPCNSAEERQPVASPRNHAKSEASISSRSLKAGNLANVFLAAISKKQTTAPQQQLQQAAASSTFKSPTNQNHSTTCAPLSEIAVAETNDMNGTDVNSVAGLSTVSGEEFSGSQKKNGWNERNRVSAFRPSAMPQHKSNMGVSASAGYNNNNNNNHGFNIPNIDIERLVEERVQARVAELEARIEQRLRALVSHMEDKIMQRLDTLEVKMMAAVSKKK